MRIGPSWSSILPTQHTTRHQPPPLTNDDKTLSDGPGNFDEYRGQDVGAQTVAAGTAIHQQHSPITDVLRNERQVLFIIKMQIGLKRKCINYK